MTPLFYGVKFDKPRHHRLQFSLRTALLLTTVIAVFLGFWTSSARRQRAATDAILALGGSVTYDFQAATGTFVADATPRGPIWLRFMVGRDWFDSVYGVGLYDADGASDEQIADSLRGVPDTRSLQLDRSSASIETMASISRMKSLRNLMLFGTAVDDRGLEHLYKLSSLQNLDLRGTRVTKQGVQKLQSALPNCTISADFP
jgi:hypothetical protein